MLCANTDEENMKTHRETGDPGYRGGIIQHFCSTVSFWKLETFIKLEIIFRRGLCRTKTFFKMRLRISIL